MLSWRACHPPGTTRTEPFSPIRKGCEPPSPPSLSTQHPGFSVCVNPPCTCVCVSVFYHITVERRIEKLVKNKFHKRYRFFILLLFSAQCRDRNKSRATTASETACQGSATLSKSTSSPEDPHLPIGGTFRDSIPFSSCLERKKNFKDKECKVAGMCGVKCDKFNESRIFYYFFLIWEV